MPAQSPLLDHVDLVIEQFIYIARDHLLSWYYVKVPEDTGALIGSMVSALFSTDALVHIGWWDEFVDYAYYVNEFDPPINWTKKGTEYHFFDKIKEFFKENVQSWLDYAERRVRWDYDIV